jgi:hypothetical protein
MMKREATPQRRMRIGEGEDRQKVMDELMEQSHAIVFSDRLNRAVNPEHNSARIMKR